MFTRLLSSITNSYIVSFLRDLLSGYVENVDSKQLKASLAKGEPPHLFAKCLRMFTRLLSSITNSYIVSFLRDLLSGYVENVDSKQLKASLAKGEPPHLFAKCLRMFTRLLSSITNSYIVSFLRDLLSGYVENVDSKQLKASLAKGEVSLFDLKLKEDIFDFLSLPITVAIGYVRVLGISIPWRSLASEPIVVAIEDVIIVLKTESAAEWDEQREIQLKEE
ncbi:hypothetical protein Pmar_PMAR022593 [Perkinsus marinus ATCC 50983]|uniref:Chorein N-terminal domain-containing protein n=1 Tax=Perkinsus marinus (strain ATCC 50983 / TXsc) TaxID=423536 RepID=C5KFJ5_PERM5|nr:hypothetical protein Pmar_PMAR022593 [Perkinsus marinus ATCC 50983]EER16744.1 hypothetical protein Pmar_PMAR022593 [Perkinsus marinus ATCC 50983]|eukprot:XP_002784948.1 hypothetical protein Pmar_PMAR022593 [Perkinsus marinus ATCC 50983]